MMHKENCKCKELNCPLPLDDNRHGVGGPGHWDVCPCNIFLDTVYIYEEKNDKI